jgi:hypothetical protein
LPFVCALYKEKEKEKEKEKGKNDDYFVGSTALLVDV